MEMKSLRFPLPTDLEEVPPKHRVKQTFNFKILELIKTAGQINVSTVFIITRHS